MLCVLLQVDHSFILLSYLQHKRVLGESRLTFCLALLQRLYSKIPPNLKLTQGLFQ